jgi:uncharacterized protein YdhG (YjbR/CyaY superfamily)
MQKYETVDEYLDNVSQEFRQPLMQIRQLILKLVPCAEEAMSYGIPSYKYKGMLVGYGAAMKHYAFYGMSNTILHQFKEELEGLDTGIGSIRFKPNSPVPVDLLERIILTRVQENEMKDLIRKSKRNRN